MSVFGCKLAKLSKWKPEHFLYLKKAISSTTDIGKIKMDILINYNTTVEQQQIDLLFVSLLYYSLQLCFSIFTH
jgi:hypothetical protein